VNKILMGYRGASVMDCGYFYAPYIPLSSTPVVGGNPANPLPADDEPAWTKDRPKTVYRSIDEPWEPTFTSET